MSHQGIWRQLTLVMNRLQLLGPLLSSLLGLSSSLSQEPDIEKLRPQIRFSEDFERFPEGSEDTGSAPLMDPWINPQMDPVSLSSASRSIQSTIAGEPATSKQLVVTGGSFFWATPWISVDRVQLTKVKMTVSAVPNADGEYFRNGVTVYAETRYDDRRLSTVFDLEQFDPFLERPLIEWDLPDPRVHLKPGRQTYHLESLLGVVSARRIPLPHGPTEMRIVARFSTGAGTTFALDDLQLIEEPFEGELVSPFEGYGGYTRLHPATPSMPFPKISPIPATRIARAPTWIFRSATKVPATPISQRST